MGFTVLSACSQDKPSLSARLDASATLQHPQVQAQIRAYMLRNPPSEQGLYYLDAIRRGDSTSVELSSLIYRSEITALQPCTLTQFYQEWVLIKTSDCPIMENLDSLLLRYAAGRTLDNTHRHYQVSAQGDSVLPEMVFYDPEVLRIDLYKNTVTTIQRK